MAATIYVEVESGVFTGPVHQHQGYYAGDFGSPGATGESEQSRGAV